MLKDLKIPAQLLDLISGMGLKLEDATPVAGAEGSYKLGPFLFVDEEHIDKVQNGFDLSSIFGTAKRPAKPEPFEIDADMRAEMKKVGRFLGFNEQQINAAMGRMEAELIADGIVKAPQPVPTVQPKGETLGDILAGAAASRGKRDDGFKIKPVEDFPIETADNGVKLRRHGLQVVHLYDPASPQNGGMSVVFKSKAGRNSNVVEVATSVVHPKDVFCKKTGTAKALANFLAGQTVNVPTRGFSPVDVFRAAFGPVALHRGN